MNVAKFLPKILYWRDLHITAVYEKLKDLIVGKILLEDVFWKYIYKIYKIFMKKTLNTIVNTFAKFSLKPSLWRHMQTLHETSERAGVHEGYKGHKWLTHEGHKD